MSESDSTFSPVPGHMTSVSWSRNTTSLCEEYISKEPKWFCRFNWGGNNNNCHVLSSVEFYLILSLSLSVCDCFIGTMYATLPILVFFRRFSFHLFVTVWQLIVCACVCQGRTQEQWCVYMRERERFITLVPCASTFPCCCHRSHDLVIVSWCPGTSGTSPLLLHTHFLLFCVTGEEAGAHCTLSLIFLAPVTKKKKKTFLSFFL